MPKRLGVKGIAVAASLVAGPAAGAGEANQFAAERGARLASDWCSACHAVDVAAGATDVGPSLRDIARRRPEAFLRDFLARPHERGRMPAFEVSRNQIDDLVRYFETLR